MGALQHLQRDSVGGASHRDPMQSAIGKVVAYLGQEMRCDYAEKFAGCITNPCAASSGYLAGSFRLYLLNKPGVRRCPRRIEIHRFRSLFDQFRQGRHLLETADSVSDVLKEVG